MDVKKFLTPKNIIFAAFVLVELVIYVVFNVLSATQPGDPIWLKYSGILLCLAVSAVMIYFNRDADSVIAVVAMLFTAISDLFILVLDRHYEVGLVTFITAHAIYLYRLYRGRLKRIWLTLVLRAAVAGVLIGIICGLFGTELLVIEACIYIVMLTGNCIESLIMCNRGFKNIFFALGLLLFLGCDICVGLNQGSMIGISLSANVRWLVVFMIWVFYLPSQVFITCALLQKGNCYKELQNERKGQKSA